MRRVLGHAVRVGMASSLSTSSLGGCGAGACATALFTLRSATTAIRQGMHSTACACSCSAIAVGRCPSTRADTASRRCCTTCLPGRSAARPVVKDSPETSRADAWFRNGQVRAAVLSRHERAEGARAFRVRLHQGPVGLAWARTCTPQVLACATAFAGQPFLPPRPGAVSRGRQFRLRRSLDPPFTPAYDADASRRQRSPVAVSNRCSCCARGANGLSVQREDAGEWSVAPLPRSSSSWGRRHVTRLTVTNNFVWTATSLTARSAVRS